MKAPKAPPTVVVMFKPEFEAPTVVGTKRHTIRPPRKRQIPTGATLSLRVWTGLPYRTPQREFLRVPFDRSDEITIHSDFVVITRREGTDIEVLRLASPASLHALAQADGFWGWIAMRDWFAGTHGLPFTGCLIHWKQPSQV